jgi:hypothetical protein
MRVIIIAHTGIRRGSEYRRAEMHRVEVTAERRERERERERERGTEGRQEWEGG